MAGPLDRDTRIFTKRLMMRAPERGDYKAWAEGRHESRAHLQPWEPLWPSDALSRDDWSRRLRAWRTNWRNDRAYVFFIYNRISGELGGGVSITNVRRGPAQAASLGYWLLERATREGYMREAVDGVCDWCFTTLGLQRMEAGTLPENNRSRRVLEQCGFHEEGMAREYLEIAGARRDHVLYGRVKNGNSQ